MKYFLWCSLYALAYNSSEILSSVRYEVDYKYYLPIQLGEDVQTNMAEDFIVSVEVINFNRFPQESDKGFYSGMLAGFTSEVSYHRQIRNSLEIRSVNDVLLSTYTKDFDNEDSFTWTYLSFGQDLRSSNITRHLRFYCGMPHIYLPLAKLSPHEAFMIHITPDHKLLSAAPDLFYAHGVSWFSKSWFDGQTDVKCPTIDVFINVNQVLSRLTNWVTIGLGDILYGSLVNETESTLPSLKGGYKEIVPPTIGELSESYLPKSRPYFNYDTFRPFLKTIYPWL